MIGLVRTIPDPPICRSAEDPAKPCIFADRCHEERQRLHHYEHLRGPACSFFLQMSEPPRSARKGAA